MWKWKGPEFTGQLYIGLQTAEEVDALWAAVKDRTEVVYAVDDFDYGAHEFAIRDDSGYSLAFGALSTSTRRPARFGVGSNDLARRGDRSCLLTTRLLRPTPSVFRR
jgi:hypothetical protein